MERHYFIGEGPEADELIKAARNRESIARSARKAIIKEFDADGLMQSPWRDGKVIGLAFYERVKRPYLKGEVRLDGDDGYGYYPKLSTKEGKRLSEKLKDDDLTFHMAKFILDHLHLHRMVKGQPSNHRRGYPLYFSAAGIIDNKVLVSIPGGKENKKGEAPFPVIPEWMREVKESEWLAAQGR